MSCLLVQKVEVPDLEFLQSTWIVAGLHKLFFFFFIHMTTTSLFAKATVCFQKKYSTSDWEFSPLYLECNICFRDEPEELGSIAR